MAETSQYQFNLSEVIEALIKQQGIHSGLWTLSFEIGFSAGLFGPTQADVRPGSAMLIQRAYLARVGTPPPPPHLVVDAAKVNPEPQKVNPKLTASRSRK
jgi:hypothetical protein